MITDQQARRLMKLKQAEKSLKVTALKSGMDEKTARKYLHLSKLPSDLKPIHEWRTREDSFSDVWEDLKRKLEINPGLQAKTLFKDLQRRYPERFSDGQLRTLQRRIKSWRSTEGPAKDVIFPQVHHPGELCQSDFTNMDNLGITINKEPFRHLLYHFVLTYSNWETGSVCFSESFEALSEGLQNALWELGAIPQYHQSDRLTAAVNNALCPAEFTQRYQALLRHYGVKGKKTNVNSPHENGDVEQRHYRFKQALDQALMMRGSRDFSDRREYETFLKQLFLQLNSGRQERFAKEAALLRELPAGGRLDACRRMRFKVGPSSTIRVSHNLYSVDSRLIGETITVYVYAERLEIWYGQKHLENLPRLRGSSSVHIQYRHIIDSLIRKPGAFENYRYKSALFPSHRFRMAYDALKKRIPKRAVKEYLKILQLAAKESQTDIEEALGNLLDAGHSITSERLSVMIQTDYPHPPPKTVSIEPVLLNRYDQLLASGEEIGC